MLLTCAKWIKSDLVLAPAPSLIGRRKTLSSRKEIADDHL
jgi:hypothetical protein